MHIDVTIHPGRRIDTFSIVLYMSSSDGWIAKIWFKDDKTKEIGLKALSESEERNFSFVSKEYFDLAIPERSRMTFKTPLRLGKETVGYFEEYRDNLLKTIHWCY